MELPSWQLMVLAGGAGVVCGCMIRLWRNRRWIGAWQNDRSRGRRSLRGKELAAALLWHSFNDGPQN